MNIRITSLLDTIRTFENWNIYLLEYFHLLNKKTVIYKLKNGINFLARVGINDSNIIKENWITKPYFYKHHTIKSGDTVIDIGSHIGTFSILAALMSKTGMVYSYEPHIENFKFLKNNIKLNSIKNIKTFRLAVSNKNGRRKLYFSEPFLSNAHFSDQPESSSFITVDCITLEDIIKNNKFKKIDFLKMDCEGSEYDIISNLSRNLLKKISLISIETDLQQPKLEVLIETLKKKRFSTTVLKRHSIQRISMIYAKNLMFN